MTNFERVTKSPEDLVELLDEAYCIGLNDGYNDNLDELPLNLEWLNSEED